MSNSCFGFSTFLLASASHLPVGLTCSSEGAGEDSTVLSPGPLPLRLQAGGAQAPRETRADVAKASSSQDILSVCDICVVSRGQVPPVSPRRVSLCPGPVAPLLPGICARVECQAQRQEPETHPARTALL